MSVDLDLTWGWVEIQENPDLPNLQRLFDTLTGDTLTSHKQSPNIIQLIITRALPTSNPPASPYTSSTLASWQTKPKCSWLLHFSIKSPTSLGSCLPATHVPSVWRIFLANRLDCQSACATTFFRPCFLHKLSSQCKWFFSYRFFWAVEVSLKWCCLDERMPIKNYASEYFLPALTTPAPQ